MPNQISDPGDMARFQQTADALRAEIDERDRATAALARKNAELYSELQQRLTESESFRLVAEELAVLGERQRLARELHDSVTQSLYSVTLYADAATLALAAGKADVTAGYLRELKETAQEGMRDMRLLIFQLHPPVVETEGLVAALQARLAAVEERAGLEIEFCIEGERRLPVEIESELYWIAQEALNNVRKHASASHVFVNVHFEDANVCLEVRDDGVGFDPQGVPAERRGGLRTIAERCERIGGRLTYESTPAAGAPPAGTRVVVEVAL
jgi:signal transduction histidine kinase